MATPEEIATQEVLERARQYRARLWRNNSGVLMNPDTKRPVRFGLGNISKKSLETYRTGDYVGGTPITITPEMVGKQIFIFTNIECKAADFKEKLHYTPKQRECQQDNFNKLVRAQGGIAGFAKNWQDVDRMIIEWYESMGVKVEQNE